MTQPPRHSVGVAGIVFDEGRVLAVPRRDNGHWQPPGGILELGETIADGLRREVLEDQRPGRARAPHRPLQEHATGRVALVFRWRPISGTPAVTDEAAEVCWLTLAEVAASMTLAFAVRVIDALGDEPAIRAHDGTKLLTH